MPAYSVVVSIGLSCTGLDQLSLVPFSFLFPDLLVTRGALQGPVQCNTQEKQNSGEKDKGTGKRGAGHRRKALT